MLLHMFIHVHAYVFRCVNRNTHTYRHVYICSYFCICLYTENYKTTQTAPVNHRVNFGFYSLHICNSFSWCEDPGLTVLHTLMYCTPPLANACLITAGTSLPGKLFLRLLALHTADEWMIALFIPNLCEELWPTFAVVLEGSWVQLCTWLKLCFSCWAAKDEVLSLFHWGMQLLQGSSSLF